jgi:hypothetical protein
VPIRMPIAALLASGLAAALPSAALAEQVPWKADLAPVAGAAGTSEGKGHVDATYDTLTKEFSWTITFSGLSGPATGAHFHGPAAPGKTAPVLVPVDGPFTSPIKGKATLTPEQADTLKRGVYVDVHTKAAEEGELRGELK